MKNVNKKNLEKLQKKLCTTYREGVRNFRLVYQCLLIKNFETSIPFLRPFWALGLFGVCGLSYFWAWAFRALMPFVFQVFAHLDFWDFRLSGLWSFWRLGFESVGFLWDKKWNTIAIVMTTLATPLSEQLTTQTFQVLALINLNDLSPSFNRLFLPFGFYLEKCQHT